MQEAEHIASQRATRLNWAALGLILATGAALRLWNLRGECAWYDEVLSLQHLDAPSLRVFWDRLAQADPPCVLAPGYFTVEYLWGQVFGTSVLSLRGLSLLCGLACIPLLYCIGRRLYGWRAGLVAALCLAWSMPHVYYAQEVRMYAFVSCLCLISMLSLLLALERVRGAWWILHGAANLLLLWSNVFTGLFIVVQGLFLLGFHRDRRAALFCWGLVHASFCALLGAMYATHSVNSAFWMPQPSWRELVNAFIVFTGGRYSNENPAAYLPFGVTLDWGLAALLGLCALVAAPARPGALRGTRFLVYAWLVAPPVLLFLAAVLWKPCFLYRYVLYASFPLYLLTGAAMVRMRRMHAIPLLFALLTLYAYQCSPRFTTPFRPDYRAAWTTYVEGHAPDAPMLILKEPLNTLPMRFTQHAEARELRVAYGRRDLEEESLQLVKRFGCARVVLWRWDRREEYEAFLSANGIRARCLTLGGMPPLHVYLIERRAAP